MNPYILSQLFIYPVKSLGGISLASAKVEPRGLEHDRRWLLVNTDNQFLTQRQYPQMACLKVNLTENGLSFFHQNMPDETLEIGFKQFEEQAVKVRIWKDTCKANPVGEQADKWFSEQLGFDCRLMRMADEEQRLVDTDYAFKNETVSFADAFPFLIIGQCSLDDLNSKLAHPVEMRRFRPNFVFEGGLPYAEDNWKHFSIGNLHFKGVKPCARCILTTVNPQTGEIDSKEPLKTLTTYRKQGNKILFGQNLLSIDRGEVKVGDKIEVIEI
jgi:uncharacterized protein YcbX